MGILPGLAIVVEPRHFHQVVNHFLIGFQDSWPCWEMLGGALSGATLIQRAEGGKQQGRHWANLWNLTFCFGHLFGFLPCPRWPRAMLFHRNLLFVKYVWNEAVKFLTDCTSGITGKHGPLRPQVCRAARTCAGGKQPPLQEKTSTVPS